MNKAPEDVKAAEQEARNLLDEADKEAKAIVAKATSDGEGILKDEKKRGDKEREILLQRAETEALEMVKDLDKENKAQITRLRENCANRMEKAVNLITERIVKAHGNS